MTVPSCANCRYFALDIQTCGCGASIFRGEFRHPLSKCPCWDGVESSQGAPNED